MDPPRIPRLAAAVTIFAAAISVQTSTPSAMNTRVPLAFLLISVAIASCSRKNAVAKNEEFANRILDTMAEFATTVTEATDLESAKATAQKIDDIGDRLIGMAHELKSLPPPETAQKRAISAKIEERIAEVKHALGPELLKSYESLDRDAQMIIQEAIDGYFSKVSEVGDGFVRHFKVEDTWKE